MTHQPTDYAHEEWAWITADPGIVPDAPCGRTDIVTGVDGLELIFRCDRERDHAGRHHAANVKGVELFWARTESEERRVAEFRMRAHPQMVGEERPLTHGFSPRPSWAGTCIDCGSKPGEDCLIMGWKRPASRDRSRLLTLACVAGMLAVVALAYAVGRAS